MFTDIKDKLDEISLRRIFATCVGDSSPEGVARKLDAYRNNETWQMYGWVVDGKIIGICGFVDHTNREESPVKQVEILHIAVSKKGRHSGIGRAIIKALQEKCALQIAAETDDDAIGFYRVMRYLQYELNESALTNRSRAALPQLFAKDNFCE